MAFPAPQYAYRAQKSLNVCTGHPEYERSQHIQADVFAGKTLKYAPTGQMMAYIVGTTINVVPTTQPELAEGSKTAPFSISSPVTIPCASQTIDLAFSPSGRYLFTWERLGQQEEGKSAAKNLRVYWLAREEGGAQEMGGFTQKSYDRWQPLMTQDEKYLIRAHTASDLSIFALHPPTEPSAPADDSAEDPIKQLSAAFGLDRPISKIRVDGTIRGMFLAKARSTPLMEGSEGLGIWQGEHNGQPGLVALYTLQQLITAGGEDKAGALPQTLARKNFFKGDKVVLHWSDNGRVALFLCQSDVDNSGKSYYGETNLYLLNLDGQYECKVQLDKEGPIHDFAWNPNSREFGVVFGYMPAKTVLFDVKANPVHSFGSLPRNFLAYQPQGRLFISAGFGNLSGTIDIHDLRTRKLVTTFQAPNSTSCEWSACGRYIMTATLSPRLRVDNGVKIWWCAGGLLHTQSIEELYQVAWRPIPLGGTPAFPNEIPTAPAATPAAAAAAPAAISSAPKPTGAYRPPGARGTLTPNIFKREDEGGAPAAAPSATGSQNGAVFQAGKQRYVPGARVPGAEDSTTNGNANGKSKKNKKNKDSPAGTPGASVPSTPAEPASPAPKPDDDEAIQKKIRNLNKKLKAIQELKDKRAKGEALEATQVKKIDGEAAILQELKALDLSKK